jgi:hypothetical protein
MFSGAIRYDFQLWCTGCPLFPLYYCPEYKCPSLNKGAEKLFVNSGIRLAGNATGEEIALQIRHLTAQPAVMCMPTVCVNACTPSLFGTE